MYTGDVYLDSMYLCFPSLLSDEDLFRAVSTRFPKLPEVNEMNRDQLLDFYLKHIFPRPQRKYSRNSKGLVLRALQKREEKEGKQEEEEKTWLYPRERPKFRPQRFGRRFWHNSLETELDRKMKLQADQIIRSSAKNSNDEESSASAEASSEGPGPSSGDPGPSGSQGNVLKRSPSEGDRNDKNPPKKQRSEITWP